ncbi:MAG TPA: DUF5995 family protein, partial [Actinomycetota bacterium]|nr:DUF5995 family protein [Actinomycetota bacterium]
WGILVLAAGMVAAIAPVLPARAGNPVNPEPAFADWPGLLPPLVEPYQPNTASQCLTGRAACLGTTITQMRRRLEGMAASCDHNAVFLLAYLRTTQTYGWARNQPGYFSDNAWVNHEASVFADHYFQAFDTYRAGGASVPAAWKIALDAAGSHRVTAIGDLLLGMNAHINRDLPFVLASVSIASGDGSSHKPDHDNVDRFLNAVVGPLLSEIAARFDPGATSYGEAGKAAALQLLVTWRELAWRNAELLTIAPTIGARALVAREIEATAAAQAEALVATSSYLPGFQSASARDSYCSAHHGASSPTPYPFGSASN